MSRDIRSYFMGGTAKKASSKIEDDDSPRSNKIKIISDKGGRKKNRIIILDSDSEEDPLPPSPKRHKRSNSLDKKKESSSKASPSLVPVNIADVFGNKPVERIESKSQKNKTHVSKDVTLKDDKIGDASLDETDNSFLNSLSPSEQSNKLGSNEKGSDFKSDSSKKEIKSPQNRTPIKPSESVLSKAKSPVSEKEDRVSLDEELENGKEQASGKKESKKDKGDSVVAEQSGKHGASIEKTKMKPHEQSVASVLKERGKDSPSSVGKKVKSDKKHVKEEEEVEDKGLGDSDRKKRAILYQKYLHREGPKHPGSKEIPEGHPTCLSGFVFVVTGVMDSLDRDEATALIQRCGGKVVSSVSKNTTYIVLGEDPGPSKLAKAKRLGIKELDENGLLDLVRIKTKEIEGSGCTSSSKDNDKSIEKNKRGRNENEKAESIPAKIPRLSEEAGKDKKPSISRKLHYMSQSCVLPSLSIAKGDKSSSAKSDNVAAIVPKEEIHSEASGKGPLKRDCTMWVDKYKPTTTKSIIGQQGEKSNVNKLIRWLSNWEKYHGPGGKRPPRPGPWDKNDDGGYYKAALLSGPPGIGKTTSAHLVCNELGRDAIELNASDTRSKRLLEGEVSELTTNYSLSSFFKNDTPGGKGVKNNKSNKKKVLLMDEVDGMAGNEDRGGVAALIQLIKETRIPIICMCNDRAHPKIRSLVGYCYDLRFQRPRMEQIRGAMMSICFKEGLKISPEALADLITSTNQDVRQVLHQLNMWSANQNHSQNKSGTLTRKGKHALKDVRLGPWDVLRKVFSPEERRNTTINQQSDLFFYDYSLGPLFVFENYPKVSPMAARNAKQRLSLLARATESLAMGDIIQNVIRKENAWKLLPSQAIFSSVIPGSLLEGHLSGQIDFPAFLGKTSTKGKMERLAQEISLHTRITTKAAKESIKLDYLSYLRNAIIQPLVEESQNNVEVHGAGVQKSLQVMRGYNLLREDLDSILELSHFPGSPDPMAAVQSKVKAAFTRAYNKDVLMTPYSVTMVVKKKRGAASGEDFYGEDEEEEDDASEEDTIDTDAMIKVKKVGAGGGRGGGGSRGGRGGAAAGGSGTRGSRGRGGREGGSGDGTSRKRGKGRGK